MRNFVAILSGFLLTLGVFAGGGLTAIFFVTAKPGPARSLDGDTGALWTNKAVSVNAGDGNLERLPARPVAQKLDEGRQAQDPSPHPDPAGSPRPATDPANTASTSPDPAPQKAPAMNAAHVEWCSRRYRSYDPADDSYDSYSGVRRKCVSPSSEPASSSDSPAFSDESESANASTEGAPALVSAANEEMSGADSSSEHVQLCFDRYRSYRPEDNSYQPYGGGPRQQCE